VLDYDPAYKTNIHESMLIKMIEETIKWERRDKAPVEENPK
jgi:hypothetical protein